MRRGSLHREPLVVDARTPAARAPEKIARPLDIPAPPRSGSWGRALDPAVVRRLQQIIGNHDTRRLLQQSAPRPMASPAVEQALLSPAAPLEPGVRAAMEDRLGHDFRDVLIHAGPQAAESARALDADAYSVGNDVVFAPGRYAPSSAAGQRLLAHELAHVAQRRGAAARGPSEITRPGDPAERQADQVAQAVVSGGRAATGAWASLGGGTLARAPATDVASQKTPEPPRRISLVVPLPDIVIPELARPRLVPTLPLRKAPPRFRLRLPRLPRSQASSSPSLLPGRSGLPSLDERLDGLGNALAVTAPEPDSSDDSVTDPDRQLYAGGAFAQPLLGAQDSDVVRTVFVQLSWPRLYLRNDSRYAGRVPAPFLTRQGLLDRLSVLGEPSVQLAYGYDRTGVAHYLPQVALNALKVHIRSALGKGNDFDFGGQLGLGLDIPVSGNGATVSLGAGLFAQQLYDKLLYQAVLSATVDSTGRLAPVLSFTIGRQE